MDTIVAAEVKQYFEAPFGMGHVEVVRVEADDTQTYQIRKGTGIVGATFDANRVQANTDSATVTYTAGTGSEITFSCVGTTTAVTGTLVVYTAG